MNFRNFLSFLTASWKLSGECNWKTKQILSERNDISWDHLGKFLGSLGTVQCGLRSLLEPLGSLLGGSWGPPGAILRPLGEILGPLGVLLEPLGAVSWGYVGLVWFLFDFGPDLGPIWGPKRLPQRDQNGAHNGPNSGTKFNIKKKAFETLLDPSWACLGPFWGPSWVKNH